VRAMHLTETVRNGCVFITLSNSCVLDFTKQHKLNTVKPL